MFDEKIFFHCHPKFELGGLALVCGCTIHTVCPAVENNQQIFDRFSVI